MPDNTKPHKEVLQIAYDQAGNIVYLAGVAVVELVLHPLFGERGIPLLAETTLLVMDSLFLLGLISRLVSQIDKLILQLRKSHFLKIAKSIQFSKKEKNLKIRNTVIVLLLFMGFIWVNYSYITLRLESARLQNEIKQTQAALEAALEHCKQPDVSCNVMAIVSPYLEIQQVQLSTSKTLQNELNDLGNPIISVALIATIVLVIGGFASQIFRSELASESLRIE